MWLTDGSNRTRTEVVVCFRPSATWLVKLAGDSEELAIMSGIDDVRELVADDVEVRGENGPIVQVGGGFETVF